MAVTSAPSPVRPSPIAASDSELQHFIEWLQAGRPSISDYPSLLLWSSSEQHAFWKALTTYSGMFPSIDECAMSVPLPDRPDLQRGADFINYASLLLRDLGNDEVAVDEIDAAGVERTLSRSQLRNVVAGLSAKLESLGLGPGATVLGHTANSMAGLCAMLATASVGACYLAVDARVPLQAVQDRLTPAGLPGGQVALILHEFDRCGVGSPDEWTAVPHLQLRWQDTTPTGREQKKRQPENDSAQFVLDPDQLPSPLWTPVEVTATTPLLVLLETSLESARGMVVVDHLHGALEYYKVCALHMNIGNASAVTLLAEPGDMHWYIGLSALMLGARLSLRDPVPMRRGDAPLIECGADQQALITDPDVLWSGLFKFRSDALMNLLRRCHAVHLFGDHLAHSVQDKLASLCPRSCWINLQLPLIEAASVVLAGVPALPYREGCCQSAALGMAIDVQFNPPVSDGGVSGELRLLRHALPRYPVDRPVSTGVDVELLETGEFKLLGASNRSFTRYGAHVEVQDFYTQVLTIPHVTGVMAACCRLEGGRYFFPVFLRLEEGIELNEFCKEQVQQLLKQFLDPRLLPDQIYQVPDMLISHNGRILSRSLERLLVEGGDSDSPIRRVCARPDIVDWYTRFRAERAFMFDG